MRPVRRVAGDLAVREPRPPMRSLPRPVIGLATAAALLAACSGDGDGTDRLQQRLDAQEEAQGNLRGRIIELEDELAAATAPADDSRARALEERIGEVDARIDELVRTIDELEIAQEDAEAETRAALSSLESAVSELRGQLGELETELAKLREDQALLQRRFENHSH